MGLFNGPAYDPAQDDTRLTNQIDRIRTLMLDRKWRTLAEIEAVTGDPQSSISAQLRHLRKPRFGSYDLQRQTRGNRADGLWEYQLNAPVIPPDAASPTQKPSRAQCQALVAELEAIYNERIAVGKEPSEDFVQLTCWLGNQK